MSAAVQNFSKGSVCHSGKCKVFCSQLRDSSLQLMWLLSNRHFGKPFTSLRAFRAPLGEAARARCGSAAGT